MTGAQGLPRSVLDGLAPLPAAFFDRPTERVARALIGCLVVREHEGRWLVGRIVETEAYVGAHDLACHASRGVTARTRVLYGPPGRAYVYLVYGMHHCLNFVTEREGHGAAVLLRGLEPALGLCSSVRTDGPGRLCRALAIDKTLNTHDVTRPGPLWVAAPTVPVRQRLARGPRIGVPYAGVWAARPLRFWLPGNPFVSRVRQR